MNYTFWVSLPYATYGVEVEDGIVTDAAPIARWMVGKPWWRCAVWIRDKGGIVKELHE